MLFHSPHHPSQWNPCRSRGASGEKRSQRRIGQVSVEPLPKQGCELIKTALNTKSTSLSGTPAEAGVRDVQLAALRPSYWGLSGTPAEAGVRGARDVRLRLEHMSRLSGTPAEAGVRAHSAVHTIQATESQWNPCRSRGARIPCITIITIKVGLSGTPAEAGVRAAVAYMTEEEVWSQWNPCRSRGASL